MSIAVQEWPRRHRITVEHFYRMAEAGLFAPDERVELVNGEIIDMPPMGSRHASSLEQLASALGVALGSRAIVRQQLPLRLNEDSEPQPDIAVVASRSDRYRSSHPGPGDALLVVEVSVSTLRYDREVKVPLYARHGVPEVWIVDLKADKIHAYSAPRDGVYTAIETAEFGERSLVAVAGAAVDLAPLR